MSIIANDTCKSNTDQIFINQALNFDYNHFTRTGLALANMKCTGAWKMFVIVSYMMIMCDINVIEINELLTPNTYRLSCITIV